ncbi:hypothetical protein [Paenibacillus sp. GCM10027629]|uniref:hypothetical protein n=1 Tax=Paenibacillus sp. GCM10027629 TaxID=3273414 RepID=UPI0036D23222
MALSLHWATAVVQPNQSLRTYSNGAIVAFTQQICLVLIGGIRFSLGRFASIRPIVIGPASSQSSAAPANSQSSRPPTASAPSTRPPCQQPIRLEKADDRNDQLPSCFD